MSDTGCHPPSRTWLADVTWFIGESARPVGLAMALTSTCAGFLLKLGAAELGIMATLSATLYGAKVAENIQVKKAEAQKG